MNEIEEAKCKIHKRGGKKLCKTAAQTEKLILKSIYTLILCYPASGWSDLTEFLIKSLSVL